MNNVDVSNVDANNVIWANSANRGQVAVETLFVLAFLLALLIPVVYVLFATLHARGWVIDARHAHIALAKISDSAGKVAFGGDGARTTLEVYFPLSTERLGVRGRELVLTLGSELGPIDVVVLAPTNISFEGAAPRGMRRATLVLKGGVVQLKMGD